MEEIKAIRNVKDPVIFIDDARFFLGPPPKHNAEHWPAIDEIFAVLKHYFPSNHTTIHDDVIMCVPAEVKKILDEDWIEYFKDRFGKKRKKKSLLERVLRRTMNLILPPIKKP